jgi:sialic acid synthase SpsE
MTQLTDFMIGRQSVACGAEPIFLPDIGTFFNQDMSVAHAMVDVLAGDGIKAIKGEILHSPDICLKGSSEEVYWGRSSGEYKHENYRALIERKVVSLDLYQELFQKCLAYDMDIVVSVYDFEGAEFAKSVGVSAIKVASSNITHHPLIEYIANLGLPVILDTGHSTLEEIGRAIDWVRDAGGRNVLIEHSPLGPPHGVDLHNLRFMNTLGMAFGLPYGLSDHHESDEMLFAACYGGQCDRKRSVP